MSKRRNLKKEVREKLNDDVLRDALGRFAEVYPAARAKALENIEDVDALRASLRDMKRDAVARIDELADKFEAETTKRGITVFRAKTGEDLKKIYPGSVQGPGRQRRRQVEIDGIGRGGSEPRP